MPVPVREWLGGDKDSKSWAALELEFAATPFPTWAESKNPARLQAVMGRLTFLGESVKGDI